MKIIVASVKTRHPKTLPSCAILLSISSNRRKPPKVAFMPSNSKPLGEKITCSKSWQQEFRCNHPIQGDTWTISIKYGPMDAKFTGKFSPEGNSFSGGWRPNPGADETINTAYDIGGSRKK